MLEFWKEMTSKEELLGTKKEDKASSNKEKEVFAYIAGDVVEDVLILALDEKLKSWVLDFGVFFHARTDKECLKNYMQGDYGKVYLGDNKTCNIIGKRDVWMNLPNGGTWLFNGVKHILILKRNLIFIG